MTVWVPVVSELVSRSASSTVVSGAPVAVKSWSAQARQAAGAVDVVCSVVVGKGGPLRGPPGLFQLILALRSISVLDFILALPYLATPSTGASRAAFHAAYRSLRSWLACRPFVP